MESDPRLLLGFERCRRIELFISISHPEAFVEMIHVSSGPHRFETLIH